LFFKPNIHRKLNYSKREREKDSFVFLKQNRICQNELLFIAQEDEEKKYIYGRQRQTSATRKRKTRGFKHTHTHRKENKNCFI